jgi:TolB-like protein/tetratricopeptide (TPR) repeat protein
MASRLSLFLAELKRRKVTRVAVVYAVVSFVVWQVAEIAFPALNLPDTALTFVVAVTVLGFPIALVLAWALEVRPETPRMPETEEREATPLSAASTAVPSTRTSPSTGIIAGEERKSIAVLPFVDMSPDRDQEYFGDGVAEEVLNVLTRIPDLRIAARTSSFSYRDRGCGITEIGRELGVATVLEGSVRKADDRLRVTAQLTEVTGGFHLWSETYDREDADVFAIQDEIARSIASTLRVTLLGAPDESLVRAGTESSEAYDLYLKGRYRWFRRYKYGLEAALEYFEKAIAKDPEYALPYTGVADTHSILAIYGLLDAVEARRIADEAAQRAMALDPDLPEAHFSRGVIRACFDYDWDGSERSLLRAVELKPEFATAHAWLGMKRALLGEHLAEAFDHAETACALDPDLPYIQGIAGLTNIMGRRYPTAIEHFERSLELEPEDILALYGAGTCYSALGRHEEAIGTLKKAVGLSDRMAWYMGLLCAAYTRAGRTAEAGAIHRELLERAAREYVPPVAMAITCANVDLPEDALLYLEEALAEAKPSLTNLIRYPIWDAILSHPRYIGVITGMGGVPWDLPLPPP